MVRRRPDAGTRFIEGFHKAGKNWAWPPYIVIEPGDGITACEISLEAPAPDAGLWVIRCRACEFFAAVTAKGAAGDPKRVWLPCKTVPRRSLEGEESTTDMLANMAKVVNEALERTTTVNPYDEAYVRETKEATEFHARRLRLALDLDASHEPVIVKAFLDMIAEMVPRFRRE